VSFRSFQTAFPERRIPVGDVILSVRRGGTPGTTGIYLLHGYPQTGAMWHRMAPALQEYGDIVIPDLRGYGRSEKPPPGDRCMAYSKREMAKDLIRFADALGHENIILVGHDRGARVAHRLMLDHPERVLAGCVMDIVPTLHMFDHTDQAFASGYYHWFFLIQPDGLPERMIGADPEYFLREKLRRWSGTSACFDEQAVQEYVSAFSDPSCIAATCDEYRAGAGIDLEHDRESRASRIKCPLLVLWGKEGFVERTYTVLEVWGGYATNVTGAPVNGGHFVPEETPQEALSYLQKFFEDQGIIRNPPPPFHPSL